MVTTLATNGVWIAFAGSARLRGNWLRSISRFPKDRYRTEVESWRELQSQNIEFTMKQLREPVEDGGRQPARGRSPIWVLPFERS